MWQKKPRPDGAVWVSSFGGTLVCLAPSEYQPVGYEEPALTTQRGHTRADGCSTTAKDWY